LGNTRLLYCSASSLNGDVEYTDEIKALIIAIESAGYLSPETQEMLAKLTQESAQNKAKVEAALTRMLDAGMKATSTIAEKAAAQKTQINNDIATLAAQQAITKDPNTAASLQVKINEKQHEETKLAADTDAKVAAQNENMKLGSLKAAVKIAEIDKDEQNKATQISKTVSFVSKNKATGAVSLYHRGRRTIIHTKKPAVRRRAVAKRAAKRVVAKRAAKRVTRRR
jgi:ferritin